MICVSTTFLPAWFAEIDLTSTQVGIVLAAAAWLKIPVTLLAGAQADRRGRRKLLLLLAAAVLAIGMPLLLVTRHFVLICLLWAVLGALLSTCVPLTDSIGVAAVKRDANISYARMRLWGSVSFLVCSIAGGWLIREWGGNATIWLMIGGAALLLIAACRLPDYRTAGVNGGGLANLGQLRQIPGFMLIMVTAATLMASHAALYSVATVHWLSLGHGLPVIGALWAIGVVAEIGVFYCGPRLTARFDAWQLLALAALAGVVRWTLTAFVAEIGLLLMLQLLHSVTFTFVQLAIVGYIQRAVPERYVASAQTVYDSCAIGLVFGIALLVSGLVSGYSIVWSFLTMAGMSGGAGLVALRQSSWR